MIVPFFFVYTQYKSFIDLYKIYLCIRIVESFLKSKNNY